MAAPEAPVAVRRDERDRSTGRRRDGVDDQFGGERPDVAQATLLPCGDEQPDADLVSDRRARRGEGDPPARALAAALDGPGGGRTAAGAERRGEPRQSAGTGCAEGGARDGADDAAPREEQIQQHMQTR